MTSECILAKTRHGSCLQTGIFKHQNIKHEPGVKTNPLSMTQIGPEHRFTESQNHWMHKVSHQVALYAANADG